MSLLCVCLIMHTGKKKIPSALLKKNKNAITQEQMPKEGKWNCSTHKADGNRILKHRFVSCKHILNGQNFLLSPQRDNIIEENFSMLKEKFINARKLSVLVAVQSIWDKLCNPHNHRTIGAGRRHPFHLPCSEQSQPAQVCPPPGPVVLWISPKMETQPLWTTCFSFQSP